MFSFTKRTKRHVSVVVSVTAIAGSVVLTTALAQQGRGATGQKAAAAPAYRAEATLGQVMKGVLFTSSNVIFAAQNTNPAEVKPSKDPSLATDPLENSYGKWEAV